MKNVIVIVLLVCFFSCLYASDSSSPNDMLPQNIKFEKGKLTLVADYENKDGKGQVPVYLINATSKDVSLNAQNGNVYMKLDVYREDKKWIRAQPHRYSWCGNSYQYSPKLKSGYFMVIKGYQPKNGKKQKIRFSLYDQDVKLSSNAGSGIVSEKDIKLASQDAMNVYSGDFEFVSKVALGDIELNNTMDHIYDLQEVAIGRLAYKKFDPQKSKDILIKVLKKFPRRKERVTSALAKIDERIE